MHSLELDVTLNLIVEEGNCKVQILSFDKLLIYIYIYVSLFFCSYLYMCLCSFAVAKVLPQVVPSITPDGARDVFHKSRENGVAVVIVTVKVCCLRVRNGVEFQLLG